MMAAFGETTPIGLCFYLPVKLSLLYLSCYCLPLLQGVIRLLCGCREEGEAGGSSPPGKSLSRGWCWACEQAALQKPHRQMLQKNKPDPSGEVVQGCSRDGREGCEGRPGRVDGWRAAHEPLGEEPTLLFLLHKPGWSSKPQEIQRELDGWVGGWMDGWMGGWMGGLDLS